MTIHVRIKFGSEQTQKEVGHNGGTTTFEYGFETLGEVHAFLLGVSEMDGWSEWEQVDMRDISVYRPCYQKRPKGITPLEACRRAREALDNREGWDVIVNMLDKVIKAHTETKPTSSGD